MLFYAFIIDLGDRVTKQNIKGLKNLLALQFWIKP